MIAFRKEKKEFLTFLNEVKQNEIEFRKFSFDEFERWDVSFASGHTTHNIFLGEIKVRNCSIKKYKTAILEEVKVMGILKKKKEHETMVPHIQLNLIYFAFYNDAVALFSIDAAAISKLNKNFYMMPKTTSEFGIKIPKLCYEFPFPQALEIWNKNL